MPPAADPWLEWDRARAAGHLPTELARQLSDVELARLLSEAGRGRDDERTLLAAEALRRSNDLEQAQNERMLPQDSDAEAYRMVVNLAAERIHAAERKLERASKSLRAAPDLALAHEISLRAEEHRAHVETSIERRARHWDAVNDLHENLERHSADDRG